jgi:hypothetical protein
MSLKHYRGVEKLLRKVIPDISSDTERDLLRLTNGSFIYNID